MILRGFADSRDGQIHYRTGGAPDAPVVAFFHQTASSSAMWERVIERLAGDFRCIAFDTPGFGASFQPESIPDLVYCADRIVEALDDLSIPSVHACGHHTGGCVALEVAARYSGRFDSLTLIGPVVANEAEKAEYRKTFVRPFTVDAEGAFLRTAWDYLRMIGAGADLDLHLREMVDHLIAHRTMPMAFGAVWEQDVEALLKAVNVPLMLMCSETDVLWPLFERACAVRPDATRSIVGGWDFQPDRDPDGVADALRRFLTGK
ncbi:alpha/beta hydrolase [Rhizorhabdus wittichii]|uniref:Alpha/beta hydrolase n=1 Tax=Rhizorhabdus wittichii TaxID=160791 RepID=A0A975D0U5_9SPHN|nr:alpha/beta hydrolase [Rhizorhabdus wittichii]QTH20171.1 alpha/beta hydrolase [Rhizorhabdus wittichii]